MSKMVNEVCVYFCGGGGGDGVVVLLAASAPIQICLIGFDSHNYRVIMAFSSRPCRSEKQLLCAPACCQTVYSRVSDRQGGEREIGELAMDFG